jgi:hypothetical protein
MKSILSFFLLVSLIFSCSPEILLNKKLDGEWSLTSANGHPPMLYTETIFFSKKGTGGDLLSTVVSDGLTVISKGTYSLLKSASITIAYPNGNSVGYPYDTKVFEVTEHSKSTLKLKNTKDGAIFLYTKK